MATAAVGVQSEKAVWVATVASPYTYKRSKVLPPGSGEKVLNWGRFIQQSCPVFGMFQRHF